MAARQTNQQRKKGQRAPAYSSDGMLVVYLGALLLTALGVLLVLALMLSLPGDVFESTRKICRGLAGGLSFVLPAFPIWAGVLLFLSAHRKAPVRPFVICLAMFFCLLSFLVLISITADTTVIGASSRNTISLMDSFLRENRYTNRDNPAAYDVFLAKAYTSAADTGMGGGLLGMVLAWPLWRLLGNVIPAAILSMLLFLGGIPLLFRLTPKKVKALVSRQKEKQAARSRQREEEQHQQELLWQQQQQMAYQQQQQQQMAYQQQMAWQQQQAAQQQMWQEQSPYAPPPDYQPPMSFQPEQTQPMPPAYEEEPVSADTGKTRTRKGIFPEEKPAPAKKTTRRSPARKVQEEEDASPRQAAASWRTEEDEPMPKPRKRTTTAAAAKEPKRTSSGMIRPTDSWEDTAPWEDDGAPETPAAPVMPVLQHQQPRNAWQPELKMPVKETPPPEEEDVPMAPYVYPTIGLLVEPKPPSSLDPELDRRRIEILEGTLDSFKISAKVRHITHGPTISRFELELAPGVRVSKVEGLQKNISKDLQGAPVRLEPQIPNTPYVGVEIPNPHPDTVTLREILFSEEMIASKKPLMVALGRDIGGKPILCDLSDMPHLLIAGTTGSGKSVCINTIITSLLYRCSPQEVRMILIDPKQVELSNYADMPHLLVPIITNADKALHSLIWAVNEMEDRYSLMSSRGASNIGEYNALISGDEKPMNRIVIIIDELADLMMMSNKRELENAICRLTQKARACGMHLIVATQRPSADVITGLITSNIPSRIAFKVPNNTNSRIILDGGGAEYLLGKCDMLYKPVNDATGKPTRVQGCYMDKVKEIQKITAFIRQHNPSAYDPHVLDTLDQIARATAETAEGGKGKNKGDDPELTGGSGDMDLLMQCAELALEYGQLSVSNAQRRLKLGYNRAGRLVDQLEELGVLSSKNGSNPRKCLITREQFIQMCGDGSFEV